MKKKKGRPGYTKPLFGLSVYRGVSSSPHTVPLCLGVRGPDITELRNKCISYGQLFHPAHTRPGRKFGADLSIRALDGTEWLV